MTSTPSASLTFRELDGLALASGKGRLDAYGGRRFHVDDLGPMFEMRALGDAAVATFTADDLVRDAFNKALDDRRAVSGVRPTETSYLLRTSGSELDHRLMAAMQLEAQKLADLTGFAKPMLMRIGSAFVEMVDNVFWHSEAPGTGLAAFQAKPGTFEFVVADAGAGVLQSLRSKYPALRDDSEALAEAIKPNVTRFEGAAADGRGHGFDRIVAGMANSNAELRLRSGGAALLIENAANEPRSVLRPTVRGFCISVKFRLA